MRPLSFRTSALTHPKPMMLTNQLLVFLGVNGVLKPQQNQEKLTVFHRKPLIHLYNRTCQPSFGDSGTQVDDLIINIAIISTEPGVVRFLRSYNIQ